jgi:hypothetical protein
VRGFPNACPRIRTAGSLSRPIRRIKNLSPPLRKELSRNQ